MPSFWAGAQFLDTPMALDGPGSVGAAIAPWTQELKNPKIPEN